MSVDFRGRKLVEQRQAALNPRTRLPRSRFKENFGLLTTFDGGYLVPVLIDEVLPGDRVRYQMQLYVRMATLVFPQFSQFRLESWFFFVPNRLVHDDFEKLMGEQVNPGDSIAYTVPELVSGPGGWPVSSVYDYYGLPTVGQVTAGQNTSAGAYPLRGYYFIWNEMFRDQNLQNSLVWTKGASGDPTYVLQRVAKRHDYFTMALPTAQKFTVGGIPLTGQAPISGMGVTTSNFGGASATAIETAPGGGVPAAAYPFYADHPAGVLRVRGSAAVSGSPMIYAELSAASASIAINSFRNAMALQALVERDARGGTRYVETIKAHFDVTSPDARQNRPEYIGGGVTPLVVTPIAQTATGGAGLGTLGGAATGVGAHTADYAATEHGYIHGLVAVRSELAYQQGLPRHWTRRTRYDFYWPELAGLGEQAITRGELFTTGVDVDDALVFGYVPRYEEMRTKYSTVTGLFRSTTVGNIDEWHAVEQFGAAPTLGPTFIADAPPMIRVLSAGAAANGMQYMADVVFSRDLTRLIPLHGVPASLARF